MGPTKPRSDRPARERTDPTMMREMTRRLYDFALAEGDLRLAELIAIRVGSAALRPPAPQDVEFAERTLRRLARRLGLVP